MNARSAVLDDVVDDRLMTTKDLADLLQVSEKWVYKAVGEKQIPHLRIGRFVRFRRDIIEDWINGSAVATGGRG